ncbi:MAG: radical SAM protein [Planctomycetaceae bacterium]|nr:radical SAM protein [Planctomycetaceae bacterium]
MLTRNHPRSFRNLRYVYPVVSRRSGGISIGLNINNQCNFACVYCQVLGETSSDVRNQSTSRVNLEVLERELRELVLMFTSGRLFEDEWFRQTPPEKRRLNDLAFSGDGEPTLSSQFYDAVEIAAMVRRELCPKETKIVLISNSTTFHVKQVAQTIDFLMANRGEIWAKLDAGSEEYYRKISRSNVPLETVLRNITDVSKKHPIWIQSLFLAERAVGPSKEEIDRYIDRILEILAQGGRLHGIQVYTVARNTPDSNITFLENNEVDWIVDQIRSKTDVPVFTFYSK